jgi:hypothetical protein
LHKSNEKRAWKEQGANEKKVEKKAANEIEEFG